MARRRGGIRALVQEARGAVANANNTVNQAGGTLTTLETLAVELLNELLDGVTFEVEFLGKKHDIVLKLREDEDEDEDGEVDGDEFVKASLGIR